MNARSGLIGLWMLLGGWVPGAAMAEFVLSAPPREEAAMGEYFYGPVAEYLTQATGQTFVYKHPGTWTNYTKEMQSGAYDLIFDGSHFVSWRTENAGHEVLAKVPQKMEWMIVARKDDPFIKDVSDLMGRKVCAPSSPNLGMLTLWSHFSNPVREPVQVRTLSWKDGFDGLVSGKCHAAVMPKTNLAMFDPKGEQTVVLVQHDPMPNNAFTAGPRIDPMLRLKIKEALLSAQGQEASSRLRARFAGGKDLVPANNAEFRGVSSVLNNALGWGIYAY